MIEVKNATVLASLLEWSYHHKLIMLVLWVLKRHLKIYITEGHRLALHADDLHATNPTRAMDCRSWIFKFPRKVKQDVDDNWIYDPERLELSCCVYHRVGLGGWHFHFQVCGCTVYKPGWRKWRDL